MLWKGKKIDRFKRKFGSVLLVDLVLVFHPKVDELFKVDQTDLVISQGEGRFLQIVGKSTKRYVDTDILCSEYITERGYSFLGGYNGFIGDLNNKAG